MIKKFINKIFQEVKNFFTFSKRQQFVIVTLLLTAALAASQLFSGSIRIDVLLALIGAAYLLSAFALRDVLAGWEYVTLLTLPTFFTGSVFLFYYLLPGRWIVRVPILVLYAIGMYAILLCENIFNIAAERNIQLLRAAHSIGLIVTLMTVYLLMDTVLSLHLPYYLHAILAFVIVFPLVLQNLWSMELTAQVTQSAWMGSLTITLVITELVIVLSFWPIQLIQEAVLITTVFYSLVGMTQQFLVERLFTKTIREFLFVLVVVCVLVIFTTRWGEGAL